jgi:crotonobetainyl-CoA:carnitine CoA-transferase CaiB-like acyl-CoA transferase
VTNQEPSTASPLAGIVVVEIGGSVAAPFAGQILADLGAEVIKVERQAGDDARQWGEPFLDGSSYTFHTLNRAKQSITVDLRDSEERQRLQDLIVSRADIVLQNLRPGQVEALGLDAGRLRALKPSLIYCNVGAFGQRGPLSDKPGYDPLMQAFSGIMSVVGEPGRPPVRVAPAIVDMGTGMWGIIGILCGLVQRQQTGRGVTVDVSLFETAISWMLVYVARFMVTGETPGRQGSGQAGIVPYRAFATNDGHLVVAAGNDGLFARLCAALGHEEWAQDRRFASNTNRSEFRELLEGRIASILADNSTSHWSARLEEAGVPCAPVHDVRQVVDHEQTRALGMITRVGEGPAAMDQVALPISFDRERPLPTAGSPRLGEHAAVLRPKEETHEDG